MKIKLEYPKQIAGVSIRFYGWLVLLAGAMYPLGYYVGRYLLYGTPIFEEYIGSSVAWGLLVPVYVFFVLAGSGLCLIASLGHIFRIGHFEIISRRAIFLAIVMLLTGFTAIAIDIGRMDRAYIPFLVSQNFSSPMMWMMALYVMYLVAIMFEFWLLSRFDMARKAKSYSGSKSLLYTLLTLGFRSTSTESGEKDHRLAQAVGVGALVLAVAAPSNLGALFGVAKARPLLLGAYMPVFFVLTALISGTTLLLFVAILTHKTSKVTPNPDTQDVLTGLGRILGLLLVIYLIFVSWKTMTAIFSQIPSETDAMTIMISGPLTLQFWGFEIAMGGIIPFLLLLHPRTGRNPWGLLGASSLALLGMFFVRYDLIIAGQVVPSLEGPYGFYTPSQTEIALLVALIAFAAFIYSVGQKIFSLNDELVTHQVTTRTKQ